MIDTLVFRPLFGMGLRAICGPLLTGWSYLPEAHFGTGGLRARR